MFINLETHTFSYKTHSFFQRHISPCNAFFGIVSFITTTFTILFCLVLLYLTSLFFSLPSLFLSICSCGLDFPCGLCNREYMLSPSSFFFFFCINVCTHARKAYVSMAMVFEYLKCLVESLYSFLYSRIILVKIPSSYKNKLIWFHEDS